MKYVYESINGTPQRKSVFTVSFDPGEDMIDEDGVVIPNTAQPEWWVELTFAFSEQPDEHMIADKLRRFALGLDQRQARRSEAG
jgi:hypothetical protein